MTATKSKGRAKANWERARQNGKFIRAPGKPLKPHPVRQTNAYTQLRNIAMRLAKHLERLMPPVEDLDEKKAAPTEAAEKTSETSETGRDTDKKLAAAYDRLLARSDGVIDGFNTLAQLVIRLIDKERESRDPARTAAAHLPKLDEAELDRRIEEEIDLILIRRRNPEGPEKGS